MYNRFKITDLPLEFQAQITRQELSKGEHLFNEGDTVNSMFYLEYGVIRLLNYTIAGKTVEHYEVMAGEFLAEVLMVLDRCLCTAIAEVPSQVLVIPKQPWLATLRQQPELAIAFAGELSYRLHEVKISLQLRGIRSAQERVLSYLQTLAQSETGLVILNRSLKETARNLDLTPETLSRVLTKLTAEGVIHRENGKIILNE